MVQTPAFYDPERVGTLFYPDVRAIAANAERAGLAAGETDRERVLLLLIDMQVDFCHPQGTLYVPGAEDDIRRLLRFLYAHANRISHIACSLDSHYPHQIFHPSWWVDVDGHHPEPLTVISEQDVLDGVWQPTREFEWSHSYVRRLEENSRKQLVVWPYHVPVGGMGNALDPELWSAVFWHSIARSTQPTLYTKGDVPQTEHYSILRPEVSLNGGTWTNLSHEFVEVLDRYDHVLIAGEAETHCVLETVADIVELTAGNSDELSRFFILRDCMSPVVHPEIDFHAMAVERFEEWQRMGMRLIDTTESLPFL